MKHKLPKLPYEMDALESYISRRTMEFHYGKHLHTYIKNLNNLISGTKFENMDLDTIIKVADGPVFNNAAQVWNHKFYFEGLKPGKQVLKNTFTEVIKSNFGSVSFFKNSFANAAGSLFGAGWIWLVLNQKGSIEILPKSNAGNPLRIGLIPLLTCDLWEHAYYLDYQNRCDDYVDAFWKLINWDLIEKRYNDAQV